MNIRNALVALVLAFAALGLGHTQNADASCTYNIYAPYTNMFDPTSGLIGAGELNCTGDQVKIQARLQRQTPTGSWVTVSYACWPADCSTPGVLSFDGYFYTKACVVYSVYRSQLWWDNWTTNNRNNTITSNAVAIAGPCG